MFAHSQRMMIDCVKPQSWSITVNTEASIAGSKKSAVPFNLSNIDNLKVEVDWGDGTSSNLSKNDYTV